METNPDKETAVGASAMISAHALSDVITRVLSFTLAAGVFGFLLLLLLTLRHA
jgi:putative effector of murein hydrolase LrgA (UPF0299 family)